jgi:hypothetical protein
VGNTTRAPGGVARRSTTARQPLAGTLAVDQRLTAAAWLLAVPCAAIAILLVVLLGPPLSRVLYPAQLPFTLLPNVNARPEPVEGTRYLLSLVAPLLLVAAVAFAARRMPLPQRPARVGVLTVQVLAAALIVACFVKQREAGWQLAFFEPWQLLAAIPIAAVLLLAARHGWLDPRPGERRARRLAALAAAVTITAVWFLAFLNTDQSIWWSGEIYNSAFQFDETFAVLNGLTPLVDFTPAYGSALSYAIAAWMLLAGKTLFTYTIAMWGLSVVAMTALYGALLRATRNAPAALALYLPVMAFCFFGAVRAVHEPLPIFQVMPLRNVGPCVLAWLLARELDRRQRPTWWLFLAAGVVALNNMEFGVAALAGVVVALLFTEASRGWRQLARLAAQAATGLLGAYALLAVLTLVRSGALPDPLATLRFSQMYTLGGVGLDPLPHVIGLPLVIYLTYAGALSVATVRTLSDAPNRVLTGLLAWSATYGFLTGTYFMAESRPNGIPTTFLPWALTLALLALVAVRRVAASPARRPGIAGVVALLGFGLIASFVLDPPASFRPWTQVARIQHEPDGLWWLPGAIESNAPYTAPRDPIEERFIRARPGGDGRTPLPRGSAIALFWSSGHVIAEQYGYRNVVPFAGESLFTVEQLDDTLRRLRAAHGSVVLMPVTVARRAYARLVAHGFEALTESGYRRGRPGVDYPDAAILVVHQLTKWVDGRALSASAR